MAKGRKTGGRQKGVKNKRTNELEEARKGGLLPLDYALNIMRDPNEDTAHRDWACHEALPYLHPKRVPEDRHGDAQTYILSTNVDPDA